MENALLIGLSRQMTLRKKMDVIANNMANMNTSGFKGDQLLFEEHLMPVARMSNMTGSDSKLSYVNTPGIFRDFSEGSMERTGDELDVAISGNGWLVVETPQGERYTRNGQLELDTEGQLVTADGYPVQGTGGAIVIRPGEGKISISQDGTVSTEQGPKDILKVVRFENNNKLKKEGSSLFSSTEQPTDTDEARVLQGMVEKSNVRPIIEMTRMLETVRAYTSVAQALQKTSELRSQAIDKLGNTSNA